MRLLGEKKLSGNKLAYSLHSSRIMSLSCTSISKKSPLRWNSTSKMNIHLNPESSLVRLIFIVLLLQSCLVTTVFSKSSSIVLENNAYTNILVAIDSNIDISTCTQLIEDLQKSLRSLSSKLEVATERKAAVGSVDIFLPLKWTDDSRFRTYCGNLTLERAKGFQTYDYADIKITSNHPFAKSLPWTKQFRGCGQEAESIYIPPSFLNTLAITDNVKGNFLLHEWSKFRYGVFEEFGYFDDELFSPCYPKNGHSNFTGCSDAAVQTAISEELENPTPADCKTALNANANRIKDELNKGTSSIMATPHLENVERFCSSSTHNRLAPTKHNFMCNRKSVSDVIFSHRDFTNVVRSKNQTAFQNNNINFKFFHDIQDNGYAFIIEDSDDIRNKDRLKVIKQAVTQMINMMDTVDSVNEVVLMRFNGNLIEQPIISRRLVNEASKIAFINDLPDQLTKVLTLSESNHRFMSKNLLTSNILREAYDHLKSQTSFKHKIILIGSQPPIGTDEAIELTKSVSNYALSIATFDKSSEWLKWNSVPHTERVLYLPPCGDHQCNGQMTSVLTDSLLEILGSSQPRKFFIKVADIPLSWNSPPVSFRIDGNVTRFVAVFPTFAPKPESIDLPIFSSPSGSCTAKKTLNYDNLFSIDTDQADCGIEIGTWTLASADRSYFNFLQIYAEIKPGITNLVITTDLGHTLEDELLPTKQIVPVYASVSNADHPIINANVTLDLFITDVSNVKLILLDDGHYPDVTKNDGVYSGILSNYSPTPETHLGRINVETTIDTKRIVSLSSIGNAALLDPEFSTKCCGNEVPLQGGVQDAVGESSYSSFIPSFKTVENFTPSEFPPSKIQSIRSGENSTRATTVFEFVAPDKVNHYEVCCFHETEDHNCSAISPTAGCVPVEAGRDQSCSIQRSQLREVVNGVIGIIYCGIRGANSKNITGELSGNFLEIDVRNIEDSEDKCKSISDGCLPIYIFWILIGCVAGLLLIIVIGLICLCVSRSRTGSPAKKNKSSPPTPHNRNITGKFPDKDSPLYNVFVNQAYIQDSDGQLKLVAADGELLPYDPNTNEQRMEDQGYATQNSVPQSPVVGKHGMPPAVRRRSISANAVERENFSSFKDNNDTLGRKHVSWNSNTDMNGPGGGTNQNNNYNDDYPEPYGQSYLPPNETNLSQGNSRSQEFIAVVPKPKDRFPKPYAGYANPATTQSTRSEATTMTPVPSVSSAIEAQNRNQFLNNNADDDGSLGPIYASVSRNGHRPYNNNTQSNVPVFNRFGLGNHPTLNPIVPKKPQNISAKNNSTTEMPHGDNLLGTGRFTRGYNNPSRKSVRLDAFPSSESETYSDISRGIPIANAPPLPPPLPSAGDLNRTTTLPRTAPSRDTMSHRTNGDGSDRLDRNSSRTALRQPPSASEATSRSPPVDNSFAGIKTHLEQHMKNKNFNRPPPPPRHDKLPVSSVSSFGSRAVEMGEVNQQPDYYEDEGSDSWDDGDDFEDFNQGQSFA